MLPEKPARLGALTSLRFFAAMAVAVHHSMGTRLPADFIGPALSLSRGVSFFFVLSGFILYYVYPELPTLQSVRKFFVARVARLWFPHVAALLALVILLRSEFYYGGIGPFIANVLMIHAWIPEWTYFFSFNAVSWSISTEFGFYVLFPLLVWKFEKTWWAVLLGSAAIALGLILLCAFADIPTWKPGLDGATTLGLLYVNPLARLFEFVLGMCVALWWKRLTPQFSSSVALWTVIEVVAIALVIYDLRIFSWRLNHLALTSALPIFYEWTIHVASCFSFALLIFVMAGGRGVIGQALSRQPFILLGEISYSVYLLHQLLIGVFRQDFAPEPGPVTFLIYLVTLIAFSICVYYAIERPGRVLIKRLGARANSSHHDS